MANEDSTDAPPRPQWVIGPNLILLPVLSGILVCVAIFWGNYLAYHFYRIDLIGELLSRAPARGRNPRTEDAVNLLLAVAVTGLSVPACLWLTGRRSRLRVSGVRVAGEVVALGRAGPLGGYYATVRYEFEGREYKATVTAPRHRVAPFERETPLTVYLDPRQPGRGLVRWERYE